MTWEESMTRKTLTSELTRRDLVKAGAALAATGPAAPYVVTARAAEVVKIGIDNPLTGPYAALGKNELVGCELALEEINAKGGILGRKAELVVEDSTSGDAGVAVQKARKLIDGDKVDFLIGNVNSALALAMAEVSYDKRILHMVPGGHTDAVTGKNCHWNVFRICNTTGMEANAIALALVEQVGKKAYYITADYAFGHTLEAGLMAALAAHGGVRVGGDLTPVGTTDFSPVLIKAQAAAPDVVLLSLGGDDLLNAMKQAVQFGLQGKLRFAGGQTELEPLIAMPPAARIGAWVMEWYWRQPDNPHVTAFVDKARKSTGRVPTARVWFGYVAAWTCAFAAQAAGSLKTIDMAKALQDFHLPPEVALGPNPAFYRADQNQLIASLFVGDAQPQGVEAEDLFKVTRVVNGVDVAGTVATSGCKMVWPR